MKTFIAAVILFAAAINGAMLYRPTPVVAAPVKAPSWLKTDKLPGRVVNPPWPSQIVQTETITATLHQPAEPISLPWSCETIRQAVANLTTEQRERVARIYRLTDRQKAEAKACLKEKRT